MAVSLQENENRDAVKFSALTRCYRNRIMFMIRLISAYTIFMRQVGRDWVSLCLKLRNKSTLRLIWKLELPTALLETTNQKQIVYLLRLSRLPVFQRDLKLALEVFLTSFLVMT